MVRVKFISLLFIAFCSSFTYSQNVSQIKIDPNTSSGGTASDFFEKIEYIPVETNKNNLFGDVSELIITGRSYVVYDFDTKSVLFFDTYGKFLRKKVFDKDASIGISYMKYSKTVVIVMNTRGSEKYTTVCLSDLGEEKSSVLVSNIKDLKDRGKLVPLEDVFYAIEENCYLASREKPKSDTTYLVNIYNKNELHKSFLPVKQTSQTAICMLRSCVSIGDFGSNGAAYTSIPLNHMAYKISYFLPLFDQSVKVFGLKYFKGNLFTTLSSLSMFTGKEKNVHVEEVKCPQYYSNISIPKTEKVTL